MSKTSFQIAKVNETPIPNRIEVMFRPLCFMFLISVCFSGHSFVSAQSDASARRLAYQKEFAGAVRTAAELHWSSIVSVELVGAEETKGEEVSQDAPMSGVVVDPAGYILTSHLVAKRVSTSILVRTSDRTGYAAELVARDRHRNLALLKIDALEPLPAIDLDALTSDEGGDPSNQNSAGRVIGQTTIALGRYGSGGDPMISTGILSADDRLEGIALQTDARISPSFYGGLLIDLQGAPMGLIVPGVAAGGAEDETSWYDAGIAFAIPLDVIAEKIDRLKAGSEIQKGLIGIVANSKDPYESDTSIAAVRLRSPAEKAGLRAGDVLVRVAGREVVRHQQIKEALGPHDAGEKITIEWTRNGEPLSAEIVLADKIPPLDPQWLGVLAEQETVDDQVVIRVIDTLPDSPAAELLRPGDEVLEVGSAKSPDLRTLRSGVLTADPEEPFRLLVRRRTGDRPDGSGEFDTSEWKLNTVSISEAWRNAYPELWMAAERREGSSPDSSDAKPDGTRGSANSKDRSNWSVQSLQLPDAANQGAILLPEEGEPEIGTYGLFVAICPPDIRDPQAALERWKESCANTGVVVCAISSENDQGWQPKEIEVVGRFAASAIKRSGIHDQAVAVGSLMGPLGGKPSAADSMAVAVAITESVRFRGLAAPIEARAPAIRLKENDPETPQQILIAAEEDAELPPWIGNLKLAGYPIVTAASLEQESLLRWIRLLQSI